MNENTPKPLETAFLDNLSEWFSIQQKAKNLDNQALADELISIWAEYREDSWENAVLAEAIERIKLLTPENQLKENEN